MGGTAGWPAAARAGDAGSVKDALAQIERAEYPAAVKALEPLAAQGDPQAQAQLGMLLYLGRGTARNDRRAFDLLNRAAAKDAPEAMFWLGRMYLLGDGPAASDPEPEREAARWYFEAARRGHAEAAYTLGLLFMAGTGVEKNESEARKWIKRAADAGFGPAQQFK